jgi:hypothetical protein
MLQFYGIKTNKEGVPKRYTISLGLWESLNTGLYIHHCYQGEQQKVLKALSDEIDRIYQSGNNHDKVEIRRSVAGVLRTRDIMRFIYENSNYIELKLDVSQILTSTAKIEHKWEKIEKLLVEFIFPLSTEARERLICNNSSELRKIMQMVAIFFMEQDGEIPPANLDLQFVKNQFPRVIWKKKGDLSAEEDLFWQPQTSLCKVTYLVSRVLSGYFETKNRELIVFNNNQQPQENYSQTEQLPLADELIPTEMPDRIEITLQKQDELQPQPALIPESVSETLLSIQKQIQREFSHEGVKHFLGIMRQFSENKQGLCLFDNYQHLKLVARLNKEGRCTEHQKKLFDSVLAKLTELQVNRYWDTGENTVRVSTPFIIRMGSKKMLMVGGTVVQYKLDPMFVASRENPFLLGQHLQLISEELFRESSSKHALLTGIASYLTGTWLYESTKNRASVQKTARQIIEGCSFNITPANRYRIRHKLSSELNYMVQKSYIGKMDLHNSPRGNPWEDVYELSPPTYYLNKLNSLSELNRGQLCG